MFWDTDTYVMDIFIFRSIVAAAAIFYIYKYTENSTRCYLSLLLFSLSLIVIFVDIYLYRQCDTEKDCHTGNTGMLKAFNPGSERLIYEKPNILQPPYWKLLKAFLETSDKFFMMGHKVIYYVYTDQPDKVECTTIHNDRECKVYKTSSYDSKARVFMKRMEILHLDIKSKKIDVQYLVCADVDIVFHDQVGVEILSDLVATLHPGYYKTDRSYFTYERRTSSQAYIPSNEGDFYYQANFFAGKVQEIYQMTKSCDEAIKIDDSNGIIAVYHDESHFNKYLLHHKPTKILSPEYIWSWTIRRTSDIQTIRVIHGEKNI
ncbi:histo-blood group ABO system transferase-like isoform X4 [Pleurodeles waltl]|uniref:histo-blood group ABO system transferase-like isoform X4 n=1 Tax=Pleurodeles waltl TaxID=8319 RepID=UPI003709BCB3